MLLVKRTPILLVKWVVKEEFNNTFGFDLFQERKRNNVDLNR